MKESKGKVPKNDFENICLDGKTRLMLKQNKVIYFDEVEENYIILVIFQLQIKMVKSFSIFQVFQNHL